MYNPIPGHLEKEDVGLFDVDLTYEKIENESMFFRKLRYRLGSVVIAVNYLERVIEECVLEMMNNRAEDPRVWILMKDFNLDKKISSLKAMYLQIIEWAPERTGKYLAQIHNLFVKLDEIRKRRNLYLHSNWLNHFDNEYFETRVRELRPKGFHRVWKRIPLKEIEAFTEYVMLTTGELEGMHYEFLEDAHS